ncbi:unnamed protein product [Hymenolepis diminuta]|uniref:M18BP n=1 Tax=Hymenolepis diminuta TaxID=6216 RepID=A0A0R3SBY5_HYMDI|nr:unnamed protein product [Hymenolepis diminuta]VUZ56102.1 unnamed protein product [Hymenolepis diminuta]
MQSVNSSVYTKPSAPVEIPDPATVEAITKYVLEFLHEQKSGKFFEPWYSERKCVFKWNEKTRVLCSRSVLPRKFDKLSYSVTLRPA